MSFLDPENPLAAEIQQEMASAYFLACRKMVDALDALKAFDRSSSPESTIQQSHRELLLYEAAERVHCVVIQRDAMSFTGGEKFFEDYDVPPEVQRKLGTRKPT